MIVVTTGVPGAGKTLWALTWVKAKAEKENRPVFYSGIADLKLPWTEIEAEKWADCPPNAIIVIDECQRVFRPRMHGAKVPEFVEQLETHRHKGVDLVLITQHPMLVDSNVRRLCGLHFHVMRKWGTKSATVHEWGTIKDNCDKSRDDSVRHEFRYPTANFALYKSAEVHTHKARIPYHFFLIALVPVAVGYAAWRVYHNWFPQAKAKDTTEAVAVPGQLVAAPPQAQRGGGQGRGDSLTVQEYIAQFAPRVPGLHYTAPVYDKLTDPSVVPMPAACLQAATRCECFTQQATRLDVPQDLCRSIVAGGFFVSWSQAGPDARQGVAPPAAAPTPAPGRPGTPL